MPSKVLIWSVRLTTFPMEPWTSSKGPTRPLVFKEERAPALLAVGGVAVMVGAIFFPPATGLWIFVLGASVVMVATLWGDQRQRRARGYGYGAAYAAGYRRLFGRR